MKAPVFIAPAMDLDMFAHPSTQANLHTLQSYGNTIIEPESGFLASGLEGKGRMRSPEDIVETLDTYFEQASAASTLKGKRILITAGPTYEKIDPVRFLGNYSSGKMGFAIAEECRRRGAEVVLIAGPVTLTCSDGIRRIDVESCQQMYEAAVKEFPASDVAVLCAAVADFTPCEVAGKKIKRTGDDMTLRLRPNPDIAATLGAQKRNGQTLVAFALETDNERKHALDKMKHKNADLIVLNSLRNEGTCFQSDQNQIDIITPDHTQSIAKKPKKEIAKDIADAIEQHLTSHAPH